MSATERAILDQLDARLISPEIALTRLILGRPDPAALRALLEAEHESLARLLAEHAEGIGRIAAIIREEGGTEARDPLSHWRTLFDRAAELSPEASVAFYSLGSPAILARASEEIVDLLDRLALLGPDTRVVELGCGIGRLAPFLAPRSAVYLGLDIAWGMLAEARRRHGALTNVAFAAIDGRGLTPLAAASVDLLLAVDVMPYIHDAGAVGTHFAEAAQVLAPGGHLVVLNFSYRGDLRADTADFTALCAANGLAALRAGARDFALWDGATFLARRG